MRNRTLIGAAALLALTVVVAPAREARARTGPAAASAADSLRTLYEQGRTLEELVTGATRRAAIWRRLTDDGTVDADIVERARAVGGTWRILAVAEDWCGDSTFNLPYVEELVSQVPGLEIRIVDSRQGRWVMESHRTPDGRAATPTLLLLDEAWNEAGCFVERPAPLVDWYQANLRTKTTDELHDYVLDFYDRDQGRATATEIVEILEAAAAGRPRCPATP